MNRANLAPAQESFDAAKQQREAMLAICRKVHDILTGYYAFSEVPNFNSFLMPPTERLGLAGMVYCEESPATDEVFIGMQFGRALTENVSLEPSLSNHCLAVIAEETSHLQGILDACTGNHAISILDLEILGEIDRFLCLMHWNTMPALCGLPFLATRWDNLHDICDVVFAGDRFGGQPPKPLYLDAEALALRHLQTAFKANWNSSRFDFTHSNKEAAQYLSKVRQHLFKPLKQAQQKAS